MVASFLLDSNRHLVNIIVLRQSINSSDAIMNEGVVFQKQELVHYYPMDKNAAEAAAASSSSLSNQNNSDDTPSRIIKQCCAKEDCRGIIKYSSTTINGIIINRSKK
jgi:hypothetical protein